MGGKSPSPVWGKKRGLTSAIVRRRKFKARTVAASRGAKNLGTGTFAGTCRKTEKTRMTQEGTLDKNVPTQETATGGSVPPTSKD